MVASGVFPTTAAAMTSFLTVEEIRDLIRRACETRFSATKPMAFISPMAASPFSEGRHPSGGRGIALGFPYPGTGRAGL